MTSSTTKREYSVGARADELNRALRRPRRILWAYCHRHGGGYYFFGISLQTWNDGEKERWSADPDMRKVRGTCMSCNKRLIFFVHADELKEYRYSPIELCNCGLPHDHKAPPFSFLHQYNAAVVPCRPIPNGRANI